MQPRVQKVYDKLSAKDRARIERSIQHYCNGVELPDTLFGFESREKTIGKRGTEVGVFAFKTKGTRVYGVPFTFGSKKFVCSEIDVNKKQMKADPDCLERAARNVSVLVEEGWKP